MIEIIEDPEGLLIPPLGLYSACVYDNRYVGTGCIVLSFHNPADYQINL